MRRLFLCLILTALPLCCGCGAIDAQAATEPGRVLWNETDAAASIASMQSANTSRFDGLDSRLSSLEQTVTSGFTRLDERLDAIGTEAVPAVRTFPDAAVSQELAVVDPVPEAATTAPSDKPICITVADTDYDLDEFLEDWCRPESDWTWEGQEGADPEGALRRHLADDLAVTGIDALAFADLVQVHEAVHHWTNAQAEETVTSRAREKEPEKTQAVTVVKSKAKTSEKSSGQVSSLPTFDLPEIVPTSTCPNGQCPLGSRGSGVGSRVTTSSQSSVRWFSTSSASSRKAQRLARKSR